VEKNIFELASRKKIRFNVIGGVFSVEDLWDLPLESKVVNKASLDSIYKSLNREIKNTEEESIIVKTDETAASSLLKLQFEIVKHIIFVKLEEKETARKAAERKQNNEKILAIIESKQDENLKNMDIDELKKLLAQN
jgi:hypothetical protein